MHADRSTSKRRAATRSHPCPVCAGDHKCSTGQDGLILCGRRAGEQYGFVYLGQAKGDEQYGLYRPEGDPHLEHRDRANGPTGGNGQPIDWPALADKLVHWLKPEARRQLAVALGLPEAALASLPIGSTLCGGPLRAPCWTFPELDGAGRVIGITCRYEDGGKMAWPGGRRGLIVPLSWRDRDGPLLLPEGPSDTLALTALGLAAVGRPSNVGGVEHLVELLQDLPRERRLIVLAEWDPNHRGQWPGRDGAVKTAEALAARLGRPVDWALPPARKKDVRAWVLAQDLAADCADAWQEAGELLLGLVEADSQRVQPDRSRRVTFADPVPLSHLQKLSHEARWVWDGYMLRGGVTLLSALWKIGKTTLLGYLLREMEQGGSLCGLRVAQGRVLIVAEESEDKWADRRDEIGLADHCKILFSPFLQRPDAASWHAFLAHIRAVQLAQSYDLIVFDTIGNLWPVKDENDAAQVQAALMPVRPLLQNSALALSSHFRKSGGDEATATRGSGALMGFADVILELRSYDAARPTDRRRVLTARSRWKETPPELVVELSEDGSGYQAIGDRQETTFAELSQAITLQLPTEPPGWSVSKLLEEWGEDRKPRERALYDAMTWGIGKGLWKCQGEGRKGSPFTYWTDSPASST